MAQHDYTIDNATGVVVRADLNNALAAIVTNNSGAAAPSPTFAFQWWVDTAPTPALIKQRNAANTAWITVGRADTATLGLADRDTRNVYTKAQDVAQVTLTDAATINTDASLGNVFLVTLAGNRALANPTNLVAGQTVVWHIRQDATGGRTLTYGTLFKFVGMLTPTLSTAPNAKDVLDCSYDGVELLCTLRKPSGQLASGVVVNLGNLVRTEVSASAFTVDCGTVEVGDRILFFFNDKITISGSGTSMTQYNFGKKSGTAAMTILNNVSASISHSVHGDTALSGTAYTNFSAVFRVTAAGTLVVGTVGGISTGVTGTASVAFSNTQCHALVLRNG